MDPRAKFAEIFAAPRALIGMVHVGALPGSPRAHLEVEQLVEHAVAEARAYRDAGFTAIAIENMHDRPYRKGGAGPEVTAAMAVIGREIRRETGLTLGVQVLAGANREALAVAHERGPDGVRVFADIKKKHSAHAITADVSLAETARAAEFFLADAVIVTGNATGAPATRSDVSEAVNATKLPVLVGSGITPTNIDHYSHAHGFIVGSSLKAGGVWSNALEPDALRAMMTAFNALPRP